MNLTTEILDRVESLPLLPTSSVQLIQVIGDPNASISEIVEVIRFDQALTAEILRLCNSPFFGLSRQISSLNDATVYLGTVKLLQLVMSVHTRSLLTEPQDGYGLDSGDLWRQSVATALSAVEFARTLNFENRNLAFTAGLLHNVGKIVLSRFVSLHQGAINETLNERHCSFEEAEQEVLGMDHSEVGALTAQRWNLPETLVRCIRYQFKPSELDPTETLVDIIYLAKCVCLFIGISLGTDELFYRADDSVMVRNELSESDLERVGMNTWSEFDKICAMESETTSAPVGA